MNDALDVGAAVLATVGSLGSGVLVIVLALCAMIDGSGD
jgi:hypothetical protein